MNGNWTHEVTHSLSSWHFLKLPHAVGAETGIPDVDADCLKQPKKTLWGSPNPTLKQVGSNKSPFLFLRITRVEQMRHANLTYFVRQKCKTQMHNAVQLFGGKCVFTFGGAQPGSDHAGGGSNKTTHNLKCWCTVYHPASNIQAVYDRTHPAETHRGQSNLPLSRPDTVWSTSCSRAPSDAPMSLRASAGSVQQQMCRVRCAVDKQM